MIVRQAANVLDLLEFFARRGQPATLAEVSAAFGWPRSSTFNILTTLAERGFLYEPRPRAGYYPSPRWMALAQEIAAAEPLPDFARPLIERLSAETGETAAIVAPAGTQTVFLDVVESPASIRYFAQAGHRLPIHATSSGRALLTQYPRQERLALYRRIDFQRYSDTTPLKAEDVEARIAEETARGWHSSHAEYSVDLAGVAVPLPLGERRLSVVIAGPMFRMQDRMAEIAEILRKEVASASPRPAPR
ncbi:MAG: IclR family transcriptional regulator [Oceanibaculum sp.]